MCLWRGCWRYTQAKSRLQSIEARRSELFSSHLPSFHDTQAALSCNPLNGICRRRCGILKGRRRGGGLFGSSAAGFDRGSAGSVTRDSIEERIMHREVFAPIHSSSR